MGKITLFRIFSTNHQFIPVNVPEEKLVCLFVFSPDRSVYFQFPILNLWLLKWDFQLVEDRNLEFTSDFSVLQNIFLERGNLSHSCYMALQFAHLVASCSFRSMYLFRKFWHSFEVKEMFLEDILQGTGCTNKEMVNW